VRFRDFLRVSVLIYGAAATVLAAVSVVGATRSDSTTLVYVAAVWWCLAVLIGLWLGRRLQATDGIARLLAEARSTNSLPELEPGAVMFNRLWAVAVATVLAGAIGFFFPVVPQGQARIRTQISAAHTREHLDRAIAAFTKIGRELGVIGA